MDAGNGLVSLLLPPCRFPVGCSESVSAATSGSSCTCAASSLGQAATCAQRPRPSAHKGGGADMGKEVVVTLIPASQAKGAGVNNAWRGPWVEAQG